MLIWKLPRLRFFGISKEKEVAKKTQMIISTETFHIPSRNWRLTLGALSTFGSFRAALALSCQGEGKLFPRLRLDKSSSTARLDRFRAHVNAPKQPEKKTYCQKYTCWLSPLSSHVNNTSFKPIPDPFCSLCPYPSLQTCLCPAARTKQPKFFPDAFFQNIADHIHQWG